MNKSKTISLKPYAVGKPSGLPWLGKVPQHWEILRGKHIFDPIDTRSQRGNEELLTVSANRGVIPRNTANVTMFEAENYTGYKLCWPGDLVINSLWAWAQGLGISQYHGIISSAYGVYRLKPEFREYTQLVHYLVRSVPFHWELQVRSKGIWISRLQLTDEAFLDTPFPIPPPDEQAAIVRYLVDVDQRIRAYVNAKERLIALLEEERQAVIHQAVTKGLDPNVRLTPSGVEWLGDVPEHWQMERGKQLLKKTERPVSEDDEVVTCFRDGEVTLRKNRRTEGFTESLKEIGYQGIKKGDLVIHGMDAFAGSVGVSDSDGKGTPVYSVCETASNANAYYYALVIREMARNQWILALAKGIRERSTDFRYTTLAAEKLPLPPITNQTAIVKYLDKVTADTDATVDRARRQVELMEEYRTRLIADVVTGKIDVTVTQARGGAWTESLIPANQAEVETACE